MMKTLRRLAIVLPLLAGPLVVLTLPATPADSAPGQGDQRDHDRARAALQAGEVKPLRDVMETAGGQFHGDMVEAELDRRGPFWIYEITLLAPDGSILKLYYDAATLALVKARGHDVERWFKGEPTDFPDMSAARSAMHERMHEQWRQRWQEEGGPGKWLRHWWRGDNDDGREDTP